MEVYSWIISQSNVYNICFFKEEIVKAEQLKYQFVRPVTGEYNSVVNYEVLLNGFLLLLLNFEQASTPSLSV